MEPLGLRPSGAINRLWSPLAYGLAGQSSSVELPGLRPSGEKIYPFRTGHWFDAKTAWECTTRYYGQAAVTYRIPSDHRSQAPSSGASTWMGDHKGTPRAVGNTWCTRHMAKPRPQVGRVCLSHHQNTPQFTTTKRDWSLDLSKKKKKLTSGELWISSFSTVCKLRWPPSPKKCHILIKF